MRKEKDFKDWLQTVKGLSPKTAESRISNCRRLDELYNLDKQYELNRCGGLLRSLSYSKRAERLDAPVLHKIPIEGNLYDGTAILRRALRLFIEFMDSLIPIQKNTSES